MQLSFMHRLRTKIPKHGTRETEEFSFCEGYSQKKDEDS
jgi:hypothetical protein